MYGNGMVLDARQMYVIEQVEWSMLWSIRSCITSQDVIILKNVASTSYQHKYNVKAQFVPFCTLCNYTYEQIVLLTGFRLWIKQMLLLNV